jgi:hypothetical protein
MNILLISPPVFMPTVMPYSLAMMKAVLDSSLQEEIKVLDLNAIWHKEQFKEFYSQLNKKEYFSLLTEFVNHTRTVYPTISKDVIANKKPVGYESIISLIKKEKPEVVAISLTYNSQIFFAKVIIEELNKLGIKVVLGGPADYSKICRDTKILANFEELGEYLVSKGAKQREVKQKLQLDYSNFNKKDYFTTDLVYPLRTAHSCPYQQCTFCTHHNSSKYQCFDLDIIKDAIIKNKIRKVCFIDDDFTVKHLKNIIEVLEPLNVQWWCQLRPVKGIISLLPQLYSAGLRSVAWGVESGSPKVLDLINKGTKVEEVEMVLCEAKKLGIKNMLYIMFGFPGEMEKEFLETINFLENNSESIDLISTSVFGLQQGSKIFQNPNKFGVEDIKLEKRTYLSDKVDYQIIKGNSVSETKLLKKKYSSKINQINKIPKIIAACKEQVLNLE